MGRDGIKPDFVARVVVDAELYGNDDAAERHNISTKTVSRYRAMAKGDANIAALCELLRQKVDEDFAASRKAEIHAVPAAPHQETLTEYIARQNPKHANPIPWHLQQLIALLERALVEQLFVIVSMPPRHGKTITIRRAIAWAVSKFRDRLNGLAMYAERSAFHQSRQIRNMVKNDRVKLQASAQSVGLWLTDQEGGLFAAGTSGQWTGKGIGGILAGDDLLKGREQAESQVVRDKLFDTVSDDMLTRLEDPVGSFFLVNTRWHEDDPPGRLLARSGRDGYPTFIHLNLPALRDPITGEPSDADDAIALWPERFSVEKLRMRRALVGPYSWNSLYQGRPTPSGGAVFQGAWLKKRWTELPPGGTFIQSWDCAFAQFMKSHDFVVGQVWYQHESDFYLVDQVREHLTFAGTLEAIRFMTKKWPRAALKLIEKKANGEAVVTALKREIPGFKLVAPDKGGSKVARARAVEGLFAGGNVYLPNASWLSDYMSEMISFPNSKFDDQVDATTQALNELAPRSAQIFKQAMRNAFAKRCTECNGPEDRHREGCPKAPPPDPPASPPPADPPPTPPAPSTSDPPPRPSNDAAARLRAMLRKPS